MASRPVDWAPVGFDADPTPGDRERVEALAVHLSNWSERLLHQAEVSERVLSTRLGASSWSGLAAEVFADRLRALASGAREASARHKDGATAATDWSASMGVSQGSADRALSDAEQALDDLQSAELSVGALSAELVALESLVGVLQRAYAASEKPQPGTVDWPLSDLNRARREEQETSDKLSEARSAFDDAQERLEDARRRAARAEEDYAAAERSFAEALEKTLHGALHRAPHAEMKDFASAVGKLSDISSTASVNASLMDTLSRLTPDELAALIDQDPDVIQKFWKHPPSPDQVAKWWARVRADQRAAFEAAAPGVLGNLAGLPYAVRDRCNRATYSHLQAHRGDLNEKQLKLLTALENVLRDRRASLVCFNPWAKEPMVAVGFGNLDTADTVTWAAPGMLSDAADATRDWSQAARNLYEEQRRADPGRSHALVAWLGYDTPDVVTPQRHRTGRLRIPRPENGIALQHCTNECRSSRTGRRRVAADRMSHKNVFTTAATGVLVVSLGGCMSVPAVRGPEPHTPGAPQKTISELLTQWADLTNAAIAATGHTDGWFDGAILDGIPWDPAAQDVHLSPCSTRGSKDASQLASDVTHAAFERDPHPIADKMTAYRESQGFTVTRTIDWTDPTGGQSVEMRAERADGVQYGFTATNQIVAIDVTTECSDHPSIQEWAREGSLRDLKAPPPSPTSRATPAPAAAPDPDDDGWIW